MAKGRKRGCPVNIRDWVVEIFDHAAETWVRIFGLNSLTRGVEGETEDGSSETDSWAEPYITKRSGTLELEGYKVAVAATGEIDPGQAMLDDYAEQVGCESDCTIRYFDPYGHGAVADYVVTSAEDSADDTENTRTWSLEQVGEMEPLPYVQVQGVALRSGGEAVTELTMKVGDAPKLLEVAVTPEDASNRRFRVSCNAQKTVAAVRNVTTNGFAVSPIGKGTAVIAVTTINNEKVARINVTVSAAEA